MSEKTYRVKCRELDEHGKGLVSFNQNIIPVPGMLPGEYAHISLKHFKDVTEGRIVRLEEPSPDRVEPRCPKADVCGGCTLQHLSYEGQLAWKQSYIEKLYGLKTDGKKFFKILPSAEVWNYRRKIHATFSRNQGNVLLGIYEEHSHKVVPVKSCAIESAGAGKLLADIAKLAGKRKLRVYDDRTHTGLLRHVLIRYERTGQKCLAVIVTGAENFPDKKGFIRELRTLHPEIVSLQISINQGRTSMVLGKRADTEFGPGFVRDEICGNQFPIGASTFFQINVPQAEKLYEAALKMADLKGTERVIDAYCGIGTITMAAAGKCCEAIGVESNKASVTNAIQAAKDNGIENVSFVCRDAGEYLKDEKTHADVLFMDPPRAGSTEVFLQAAVANAPEKIVYVSCNPATQKRDVDFLAKHGYKLVKIQPVDLFPQTVHIESIVLMLKK